MTLAIHRPFSAGSIPLSFSRLSWSSALPRCLLVLNSGPPTTLASMPASLVYCWVWDAFCRESLQYLLHLPVPVLPQLLLPRAGSTAWHVPSTNLQEAHTVKMSNVPHILARLLSAPDGVRIPCSSFSGLFSHPTLFLSHGAVVVLPPLPTAKILSSVG